MRKYLLFCSLVIIFILVGLFIFFNVVISINVDKNKKVLDMFDSVWGSNIEISLVYDSNLPKIEIDGEDYIGVIRIEDYNLVFPVQNKCSHIISSVCRYSDESLIILGTNLKDSFSSYKLYGIGDGIIFTNTLGESFQYRIKSVDRIKKVEEIFLYDEELVIVIKNYYGIEYILFRCESSFNNF